MGMFTSSLSKMTASYLLLLVLRHLGLPPHTLPPQPNLIWWSYHIFYREIKSKQKDSVFFTSSKLLTLSISILFPAYHFTLWIRNPCSCQRPDFPTNPTVFGFHFQDFISTIFSFSCIIMSWIVSSITHYHVLVCSIFKKLYFDPRYSSSSNLLKDLSLVASSRFSPHILSLQSDLSTHFLTDIAFNEVTDDFHVAQCNGHFSIFILLDFSKQSTEF